MELRFLPLTLGVSIATLLLIGSALALNSVEPTLAQMGQTRSTGLLATPARNLQAHFRPQMSAATSGRAHKLNAIQRRLLTLEAQPSDSLDHCLLWANLVEKYETLYASLYGSIDYLSLRPNEERKRVECEQIQTSASEVGNQLDSFRELAINDNNAVEFTIQLLHEYLDLVNSDDLRLLSAFKSLRETDERVRRVSDQLEHFIASTTSDDGLVHAHEARDRVASLDESVRGLVDREDALAEDDFEQLVGLSGELERELARLPSGSGRARYLTGTLDAANAVILRHALSNDNLDAIDGPNLVPVSPVAAPAALTRYGAHELDADAFNDEQLLADDEQLVAGGHLRAPLVVPAQLSADLSAPMPTLRRLTGPTSRAPQSAPALSMADKLANEQQASSGAQLAAGGVRSDAPQRPHLATLVSPIVPFGVGRDSSFAQQIANEQKRLSRPQDGHLLQPTQQLPTAAAAPAAGTARIGGGGGGASSGARRSRVRRV